MRLSTIGKLAVLVGVVTMICSGLAYVALVVASTGVGNPGPAFDFAAEHLFVPGLLALILGVLLWLGCRHDEVIGQDDQAFFFSRAHQESPKICIVAKMSGTQ